MVIKLGPFKGLVPRLDPEHLPEGCAAFAQDVTANGAVAAFAKPTTQLWTFTDPVVPAADLASPAQPAVPTFTKSQLCQPFGAVPWLKIRAFAYCFDVDTNGQTESLTLDWSETGSGLPGAGTLTLDTANVDYNAEGIVLRAQLAQRAFTLQRDRAYAIRGPVFQFCFTTDTGGVYGGPSAAVSIPPNRSGSPSMPAFSLEPLPGMAVPLYYKGQQYGAFQPLDASGVAWDQDGLLYPSPGSSVTYPLKGGEAVFFIRLYHDTRQKFWRFCQTGVDAGLREGPPSEPSTLAAVNPGEVLTLALTGTTNKRLYRAGADGETWHLLDEFKSGKWQGGSATATNPAAWTDEGQAEQSPELPPSGLLPASTSGTVLLHPAQFGVTWKNAASPAKYELYVSDAFRPHAWPKEWVTQFPDEIRTCALVGGTIVVFTQRGTGATLAGDVYASSADDPAQVAKFFRRLASDMPLLAAAGLCRVGGRLYWPTYDGLAVCDGSGVEIVTGEFYTRAQWATLTPLTMIPVVADSAILLGPTDGAGARLELAGGQVAAVTTYTAAPGATSRLYRTRTLRLDQPTAIDYVRAGWSGATPKLSKVCVNGSDVATALDLTLNGFAAIPAGTPVTNAKTLAFEFALGSNTALASFEAFERRVLDVADGQLHLTPELVPNWGDVRLHIPNGGRFVAGAVAAQGSAGVKVTLTARDAAGNTATVSPTAGGIFALPQTALADAADWKLAVTETGGTELAQGLDGLTLYTRQTVAAPQGVRETASGVVPPWLFRRYALGKQSYLRSVRVSFSGTAPTLRLYPDGGNAVNAPALTSGTEVKLTNPLACSFIELDFSGADAQVESVQILTAEAMLAGDGPITISGDPLLGRVIKFPDRGTFAAIAVAASASATVTLTQDAGGAIQTACATDKLVYLARTLAAGSQWVMDAESAGEIYGVTLYPRRRIQAEAGVLSVTGNANGPQPFTGVVFDVPESVTYACASVKAPSYTGLVLKVFADGSAGSTDLTITSAAPFSLSAFAGVTSLEFEVWKSGVRDDSAVEEINFYPLVTRETGGPSLSLVHPAGSIAEWNFTEYLCPGGAELVSARVKSSCNVTFTPDGGTPQVVAFTDGVEKVVDLGGRFTRLRLTTNNDAATPEVALFFRAVLPVGPEGTLLAGLDHSLGHYFQHDGQLAALAVGLKSYGVATYTLSHDGTALDTTVAITDGKLFPVTRATGQLWRLDIEGVAQVETLRVVPRRINRIGAGHIQLSGDTGSLQPWLTERYELEGEAELASAVIRADSYANSLVLRVFKNGATGSNYVEIPIASGAELLLKTAGGAALGRCDYVDLEFWNASGRADHLIREGALYRREYLDCDSRGVIVPGGGPARNKTVRFKQTGSFAVARVVADLYPATLKLTPTSGAAYTSNPAIASGADFLLPELAVCREWALDLSLPVGAQLSALHLIGRAEQTAKLVDGRGCVLSVSRGEEPFSWLGHRWRAGEDIVITRGRVTASGYPVTLRLYRDGAVAAEKSVTDAKGFWWPKLSRARRWGFDVLAGEGIIVQEAAVATSSSRL
jgi:hypothetical protein